MINWLNENQGAVMAGLTLAYVMTTYVMLRASRSAVDEQVRLREAQFRPSVVVDLEIDGERMVTFFTVQNVGSMAARSIEFEISPPFVNPKKPELGLEIPMVIDGIQTLSPGRKVRTMISVSGDFDPTGVVHEVIVAYCSDDGRDYRQTCHLDFGVLAGVRPSTPKGLHTIAQTLERIERDLAQLELRG